MLPAAALASRPAFPLASRPAFILACHLQGQDDAALVAVSTKYLKTYESGFGWGAPRGSCGQCVCIVSERSHQLLGSRRRPQRSAGCQAQPIRRPAARHSWQGSHVTCKACAAAAMTEGAAAYPLLCCSACMVLTWWSTAGWTQRRWRLPRVALAWW